MCMTTGGTAHATAFCCWTNWNDIAYEQLVRRLVLFRLAGSVYVNNVCMVGLCVCRRVCSASISCRC